MNAAVEFPEGIPFCWMLNVDGARLEVQILLQVLVDIRAGIIQPRSDVLSLASDSPMSQSDHRPHFGRRILIA